MAITQKQIANMIRKATKKKIPAAVKKAIATSQGVWRSPVEWCEFARAVRTAKWQ